MNVPLPFPVSVAPNNPALPPVHPVTCANDDSVIATLQLTATVLAPTVYSAFATVIEKLVPEPDPLQMFVGVALNVTVGFGYMLTFIVFVDTDFGQPSDVLVMVVAVAV